MDESHDWYKMISLISKWFFETDLKDQITICSKFDVLLNKKCWQSKKRLILLGKILYIISYE